VTINAVLMFQLGYALLLAAIGPAWMLRHGSLRPLWTAPLVFIAHRISRPIQELTAGLAQFAGGDWDQRLPTGRNDEVGSAIAAFNDMAEQLRRQRERLVYLTQVSSWETLARKTAHELKNSLTPIRLTVEEMLARQPQSDRAFMQQAAQIVISEIETLERRVRAFSEFASEPPVNPEALDINAIVTERVSLLKPAHPETAYRCTLDAQAPRVSAASTPSSSKATALIKEAEAACKAGDMNTAKAKAEAAIAELK